MRAFCNLLADRHCAQLAAPEIMMVGGWESGWWIGLVRSLSDGAADLDRWSYASEVECQWCHKQGSHRLPVLTRAWGLLAGTGRYFQRLPRFVLEMNGRTRATPER